MKKFKLFYGLGGGFGGAVEGDVYEYENREAAERDAYLEACEEYESYSGMYGLRSVEDIMEEEGWNEEDAAMEYEQERETWIVYWVEEVE